VVWNPGDWSGARREMRPSRIRHIRDTGRDTTVTTIIFGLPTGQRTSYVRLTLPVATLTIQELIAYKVRQEVEEVCTHQRST
jgi:hypothetical protein